MEVTTALHRDETTAKRLIIVSGRAKVAEKETIRFSRNDKERLDALCERHQKTGLFTRAAIMRCVFHIGLDEAEKDPSRLLNLRR